MKDIHPLRTARRKGQRLQKLGPGNSFCQWCGCSDPMLLRPATRTFLEQHHPYGRESDPIVTLALCFNCHALATEGLVQAGVSMEKNPDPRMFAINAFRASEFHLKQLSEAQARFALSLEQAKNAPEVAQPVIYEEISLIGYMHKMAWPVWKVHRGKVPKTALRNLEDDGDWPRGTAANIMRRISKDEDLRFALETGRKLP